MRERGVRRGSSVKSGLIRGRRVKSGVTRGVGERIERRAERGSGRGWIVGLVGGSVVRFIRECRW
jgi:hypothetical protein